MGRGVQKSSWSFQGRWRFLPMKRKRGAPYTQSMGIRGAMGIPRNSIDCLAHIAFAWGERFELQSMSTNARVINTRKIRPTNNLTV